MNITDLETLSESEMSQIKGGGHWAWVEGEWVWINTLDLEDDDIPPPPPPVF